VKLAAWIALVVACTDAPDAEVAYVDRCDGAITTTPIVDSVHVPFGVPIEWPTNPPTSGTHWNVWAAWDRSYVDLPRGLWLHDAEHGGVVLAARCHDCEPFAQLIELARARPLDEHCAPPLRHRLIVTSDPLLPVEVAAIAWGVAYTATCFDPDTLAQFIADHYGRASENTCADGVPLDGVPFD
jgi:hypothetical protein